MKRPRAPRARLRDGVFASSPRARVDRAKARRRRARATRHATRPASAHGGAARIAAATCARVSPTPIVAPIPKSASRHRGVSVIVSDPAARVAERREHRGAKKVASLVAEQARTSDADAANAMSNATRMNARRDTRPSRSSTASPRCAHMASTTRGANPRSNRVSAARNAAGASVPAPDRLPPRTRVRAHARARRACDRSRAAAENPKRRRRRRRRSSNGSSTRRRRRFPIRRRVRRHRRPRRPV